MKDKLRRLAKEMRNDLCGDFAQKLEAILDAEGDGGAVAWQFRCVFSGDACGEWSLCRKKAHDWMANRPDAYETRQLYTHPARSGVVSDEDVRDAERYRWLRTNVQPFRNGNPSPHAIVKVSLGIGADQRERSFDLIDKASHVGVVTLDQAIDAAIQGQRHD